MKLSDNFSLHEFTNSVTAMKRGYTEQFNPPANIIENLKYGALNIAEPIRSFIGAFVPTVAYRCSRLNKAIKGSQTSMHSTGEALDETFIVNGNNVSASVFFWLIKNKDVVPFTELIWEKGNSKQPNWLHIGWKKQKEQEILIYDGKKYSNYIGSKMHEEHKRLKLI